MIAPIIYAIISRPQCFGWTRRLEWTLDQQFVVGMREKLAGRNKRQLIEGMIARSPHQIATEKLVMALESYPLLLLLLAKEYPTQIWLLDRGELPSSAAILNDQARRRRWHSQGIGVDDCEGLTDVVNGKVTIVVSWKTLLIMRHEFAHAVTTFFSPNIRRRLGLLYAQAKQRGVFAEPLAAESIGEYVACGISYQFFPDLSAELREVDAGLYRCIEGLLREAEELSALIAGT